MFLQLLLFVVSACALQALPKSLSTYFRTAHIYIHKTLIHVYIQDTSLLHLHIGCGIKDLHTAVDIVHMSYKLLTYNHIFAEQNQKAR